MRVAGFCAISGSSVLVMEEAVGIWQDVEMRRRSEEEEGEGGGGRGVVFVPTPIRKRREWKRKWRRWREKRKEEEEGDKENRGGGGEGRASGVAAIQRSGDETTTSSSSGSSSSSWIGGGEVSYDKQTIGLKAQMMARPLVSLEWNGQRGVGARNAVETVDEKRTLLIAMLEQLDTLSATLEAHMARARVNVRRRKTAAGIVASAIVGFHCHDEAVLASLCNSGWTTARRKKINEERDEKAPCDAPDANSRRCCTHVKERGRSTTISGGASMTAVLRRGPFSYRWTCSFSIVGLL